MPLGGFRPKASAPRGKTRGLSSAGRAPDLHSGGHRFDPDRLHQIPSGFGAAYRLLGLTICCGKSRGSTKDLHDHQAHLVCLIILRGMNVQVRCKADGQTKLTSYREKNIGIV